MTTATAAIKEAKINKQKPAIKKAKPIKKEEIKDTGVANKTPWNQGLRIYVKFPIFIEDRKKFDAFAIDRREAGPEMFGNIIAEQLKGIIKYKLSVEDLDSRYMVVVYKGDKVDGIIPDSKKSGDE
jgi:hypothetical protein